MASQPSVRHTSNSTVEDLRKQVIRLLQTNDEPPRGNILVFPQVFLEFLNYDHKMAIFLNKLLYWTERSQSPQKWVYKTYQDWFEELGFKESVIRRLIYGDKHTKTSKRTLSDIGVEVRVKRAPNGSPTCHYRINLDVFLDAIRSFTSPAMPDCSQTDGGKFPTSNPANPQDGTCGSQAVDPEQTAATSDHEITAQTSLDKTSDESGNALTRERDTGIFTPYEKRFGKLKRSNTELLLAEVERLGSERAVQVVERCATRGRSWAYVLKALANETVVEASQSPYVEEPPFEAPNFLRTEVAETRTALFETERIQVPWKSSGMTVREVWQAAFQQMELQFDRNNFVGYVRNTLLVDFDAATDTFLVAAESEAAQQMLKHRLERTIRRILSDVGKGPVNVDFVLVDQWQKVHARSA